MSNPDHFFHLDAVRADLRGRSVRSGFFTIGGRAAQALIQLGSIIILARLLTPDDFGVVAMVLPVTILVQTVTALGLQTTMIHREHLDQREVSAMFWFAARVNLLVCLAMAATGLVLPRIYDDARVTNITVAWAALLYLTTLCAVHEALLKRQLRFGTVMSLHIGALTLGTLIGITAAALGARYWALFFQVAVTEGGRSVAMWVACSWRPSRPRHGANDLEGVRALRSYWAHLSGYRILAWLGDHPDRILIGAMAGAGVVGLYDNARRLAWYPFVELFTGLTDVAVASFSRVREDVVKYREVVRRGLTPILGLSLPAIAFLFAEAPLCVDALLGDQWAGAVPYIRLMCIAAFAGALGRVTLWLYLSMGETRRQLRWALAFQTPILLASMLIGALWGAIGVASGYTVGIVVLTLPSIVYCLRTSPVTVGDYARIVARPTIAAFTATAILALLAPALPYTGSAVLQLIETLMVFGVAYIVVWVSLPGGFHAGRELVAMGSELRSRPARFSA